MDSLNSNDRSIQAENLDAEMAAGTVVVDVREAGETLAGIIPGAICLPLSQLSVRFDELPKGKKLAVYCHSGMRSKVACQMLSQLGYDAQNLEGGYMVWRRIHSR